MLEYIEDKFKSIVQDDEKNTFKNELLEITREVSPAINKMEKECIICLEKFALSEKRTILPCLHDFHFACIEKWLKNHKTCPMCKRDVTKMLKLL